MRDVRADTVLIKEPKMSESKDETRKERPHGHRDRGRADEGPHKHDLDSTKRTQAPDSANLETDEAIPYPKGR